MGAGAGPVATAVEHVDRTDPAYAAADVTVCRAGSATTAELAHVGVPAARSRRGLTCDEPTIFLKSDCRGHPP
nr:glycosyltransferase [Actinomadura kijaniata]